MDKLIKVFKSIRAIDIVTILMIFGIAFGVSQTFGLKIALIFLILGVIFYLIRDYINWWSSQAHQILIILAIFVIALYVGQMIGKSKYWVLCIAAGAVYLAILLKKPEFILLISAVLITNMFSLIPYDFLQIKGLFKLRDLILVGILMPVVAVVLVKREDIKFIFGSISARAILGFCFIILLFIIVTHIRHSHPLLLSFRVARDYFYYLFFFGTVSCIRKKEQIDFVIKVMVGLSMLFAVMYIAQALSGGALHLFPVYSGAERPIIWGVPLGRLYVSSGFGEAICFGLIGLVGTVGSKKTKLLATTGAALFLGEIFFTLGRTLWYETILIIFLIFLFLPHDKRKIFAIWFFGVAAAFAVLLLCIGTLRYGTHELLFEGLIERGTSGITDVVQRSGTFGYRFSTLTSFYYTIIKENLWFGLGFLYPGTEFTQTLPHQTVVWTESPFISILNSMGIMGLLSYILLYVALVTRGLFILRRVGNPIYQGLIIGFIAWYIGGWIGIFTTGGLIGHDVITVKALCAGLTECMYRASNLNERK